MTCTDKVKGRECRIDDWYKTLVLALSAYKFINMYILTTKIAYISTHTYTCIYVHACIYQGQQTEEKVFEKRKVFRRTDTGSMITETGSWFQEVEAWKERILTTGPSVERWYSHQKSEAARKECKGKECLNGRWGLDKR